MLVDEPSFAAPAAASCLTAGSSRYDARLTSVTSAGFFSRNSSSNLVVSHSRVASYSSCVMPYRLQAHYYSRGPMGYGLGKLQIIDHDGKGGFTFEERPFVVMVDQAFVDLAW